MDEVGLIEQAKRGNVNAFNELVLAHQKAVFNVAYRIMGDTAQSADITQDAFITAFDKLSQFQGGNLKAWFSRIVTNKCYDELRKQKRRPQSSLDEIVEVNESASMLVSKAETPEQATQRKELVGAVAVCLDGLPDDQRVTAVLCDIEGHIYQEIAEMLDVSLGTVKSRMSRARGRLRDCLQGVAELLPASYRLNN